MSIRIALRHQTRYRYDRDIELGPQVIRLRPAAHCRTPIDSYSLNVQPAEHFLNWQQDPHGNYLARCVFPERVGQFSVEVELIATLSAINPFDFFLEPAAESVPFFYASELARDLEPYLAHEPEGVQFDSLVASIDRSPQRTIDFLVALNRQLQERIDYVVRMEPGVQTPEETLTIGRGSCRDSAWLLAQLLRHLGYATRFVSGYLVQLVADVKSLDGPSGPSADFTDLHAWTEVFLPGAGWVGLDPTSGLLAGEGHIPLACTPHPISAAPITGAHQPCEVDFDVEMSIERVHEDPRVTKPYTEAQWSRIEALGHDIDARLAAGDVRLTMGGEPTFVSIDDMEGDEWQNTAHGPAKWRLAGELLDRLRTRFAKGGLVHHGQGKWYPGETLPRWALHCYWRSDGVPLWKNPQLFAAHESDYGHGAMEAERFARALAERLEVDPDHAIAGYEDAMYYAWRERRLPANVTPGNSEVEDELERTRIARLFEQGLASPVGYALPLEFRWWEPQPVWRSGAWVVRSDEMFLIPGDSPMGFRLPLASLLYEARSPQPRHYFEVDPFAAVGELPGPQTQSPQRRADAAVAGNGHDRHAPAARRVLHTAAATGGGHGDSGGSPWESSGENHPTLPRECRVDPPRSNSDSLQDPSAVIRTALCVEPRQGRLHIFMPPIDRGEVYIDLVNAIEDTCHATGLPVLIEGYLPPHHSRLKHIKVTPDPGVLEVNVHPAHDWNELVAITTGVYEDAHHSRLGTEKFDLDGSHTGTGGGNHVLLGGPTPADSPWLRRPDLLKSFLGYWHNHPSLSYLFSGKFIGPTSQAPRVDESRPEAVYELKIAFEQIAPGRDVPPWIVDRVFRHLLVDVSGNTHRSEFCIDKLFSPDSSAGRLGLVEFRNLEMPPHARMSLTQQLLLRAMVARFWEQPYGERLVAWNTVSTIAGCCRISSGSISKTCFRRWRTRASRLNPSGLRPILSSASPASVRSVNGVYNSSFARRSNRGMCWANSRPKGRWHATSIPPSNDCKLRSAASPTSDMS